MLSSQSFRTTSLVAISLSLTLVPAIAQGETGGRSTIAASGEASEHVATDEVRIVLGWKTASNSFSDAMSAAENVRQRLEQMKPPENTSLVVEHNLAEVKRKNFAWSKGKKLEHQFTLSLSNLPQGQLEETVVHLVDESLELEPSFTVETIQSDVSVDKIAKVQASLLEQAVHDARANAEIIAAASRLRIVGVQSIDAVFVPGSYYPGYAATFAAGIVPARHFTVYPDLDTTVLVSQHVSGRFLVEPR